MRFPLNNQLEGTLLHLSSTVSPAYTRPYLATILTESKKRGVLRKQNTVLKVKSNHGWKLCDDVRSSPFIACHFKMYLGGFCLFCCVACLLCVLTWLLDMFHHERCFTYLLVFVPHTGTSRLPRLQMREISCHMACNTTTLLYIQHFCYVLWYTLSIPYCMGEQTI